MTSEVLSGIRFQPAVPRELDLGPMRIEESGPCWENGSKKHILTIRVGDSVISILSSATGASVHVLKDGIRLHEPEHDFD